MQSMHSKAISGAYADLYLKNPEVFVWRCEDGCVYYLEKSARRPLGRVTTLPKCCEF